jgi:hypothetical protein
MKKCPLCLYQNNSGGICLNSNCPQRGVQFAKTNKPENSAIDRLKYVKTQHDRYLKSLPISEPFATNEANCMFYTLLLKTADELAAANEALTKELEQVNVALKHRFECQLSLEKILQMLREAIAKRDKLLESIIKNPQLAYQMNHEYEKLKADESAAPEKGGDDDIF